MRKRIAAAGLTIVLMFGLIAGAGRQIAEESERNIKEFTAFFTTPGEEMHTDNEIQNLIARKIGAKCTEYWLNGQTEPGQHGIIWEKSSIPIFRK